ncbi:MAG TPA: formate dehydrogenase subunit gamma [Burkholderiaceae bacterium]|jgi:formate dehydrogenase subunit gamma|nr:formate dehydrogenase subunit gamma [Burkholderiaceae bacterium]
MSKQVVRTLLAAAALGASLALAPAHAQAPAGGPQSANIFDLPREQAARQQVQPLNNAPVWREVNSNQVHSTTLPRFEGGRLIQREGEQWRQLRNGPITIYGGWTLVGVLVLLALFWLIRGTMRLHGPPTGRLIERFTAVERAAHWTTAISFVVLAISGLVMLFGKHVLLPVFGYSVFAAVASASKTLHNFIGPLFTVSIIVTFAIFVKDNWPRSHDLKWFRNAGGMLGGGHVPSGRFNAGEKMFFWGGLTLLGVIVSVSGFVLLFPNFEQTRATMQLMWTWHVVAALLFVAASFGHIYMGTIGVAGAYRAMRDGYVDETWAREHHEYWYQDVKSGKVPAVRSGSGRQVAAGHTQQA